MDKNDNDNDDVRGAYQCQDVGYLACMLLVTLPIFFYSLCVFNSLRLQQISMPRSTLGTPCPPSSPFLEFTSTSTLQRHCTAHCTDSTPNLEMGGICMGQRVEYILRGSGEYSKYIESHFEVVGRLRVIGQTVGITVGVCVLLALCSRWVHSYVVVGLGLVVGVMAVAYLMPGEWGSVMQGYHLGWLLMCKGVGALAVYAAVWCLCKGVNR